MSKIQLTPESVLAYVWRSIEIGNVDNALGIVADALKSAQDQCATQAAQIAALQGEIDTYDDIVADLRAKVAALEAEQSERQQVIDALHDRLTQYEEADAANREGLTILGEEKRALEAEIAEWEEHGKTCRSADLAPFLALATASNEILALIEEGWLVRNTENDAHFPSYMAESVRLVEALKAFTDALAAPAVQRAIHDHRP